MNARLRTPRGRLYTVDLEPLNCMNAYPFLVENRGDHCPGCGRCLYCLSILQQRATLEGREIIGHADCPAYFTLSVAALRERLLLGIYPYSVLDRLVYAGEEGVWHEGP